MLLKIVYLLMCLVEWRPRTCGRCHASSPGDPLAWADVWICADPQGYIQVTGAVSRSETRSRAMSWGLLRDQWHGWDHLEVLLSPAYRLLRCLFDLLAVLVGSDLSKDAELLVLRHENQMLRRQLRGRLRWDHAGRLWLAALSRLVSRRQWPEVFPVTPATILR